MAPPPRAQQPPAERTGAGRGPRPRSEALPRRHAMKLGAPAMNSCAVNELLTKGRSSELRQVHAILGVPAPDGWPGVGRRRSGPTSLKASRSPGARASGRCAKLAQGGGQTLLSGSFGHRRRRTAPTPRLARRAGHPSVFRAGRPPRRQPCRDRPVEPAMVENRCDRIAEPLISPDPSGSFGHRRW